MALKVLEGFRARVLKQVKSNENSVILASGDAAKLNAVGAGNYAYLSLHDPVSYEVVKYIHTSDWGSGNSKVEVPIVRDQGGTGAKNFSSFACLNHEASVPFLTDFVNNLIASGS